MHLHIDMRQMCMCGVIAPWGCSPYWRLSHPHLATHTTPMSGYVFKLHVPLHFNIYSHAQYKQNYQKHNACLSLKLHLSCHLLCICNFIVATIIILSYLATLHENQFQGIMIHYIFYHALQSSYYILKSLKMHIGTKSLEINYHIVSLP